jgi:hypothetical protein
MPRRINVIALAVMLALAAAARAEEPTSQQLLEQIKQLQAQVERLEAKQKQSNADVAATIDQIVRDAEQRSNLLQTSGDILAGREHDKFFIRSADGNFMLSPSFEIQIRNLTNYETGGDSIENGFEIRRMKFRFEGHALTPNLTYAFQWATISSTGTPRLEDAWVRYQFEPGWFVRGGQFKDPLVHEQAVSGRRLLAADRTLLTLALTGSSENYTQGVTLLYDRDKQPWRAEVGFTDGGNSDDTTWRDAPANGTNFGVVGRVEYFARGDRKAYEDFTALNTKNDLLVFGGGADATQGASGTTYLHTLDMQYENTHGCSGYAAFLGRYTDASDGSAYDWGFVLQGGYLFRPRWEGFARYDFLKFEDEVEFANGATEDLFHEFTVGVNYYIHGHSAKFTVDGSYLPNGSPSNQIGLGILSGDDAQFNLRGQFQLLL